MDMGYYWSQDIVGGAELPYTADDIVTVAMMQTSVDGTFFATTNTKQRLQCVFHHQIGVSNTTECCYFVTANMPFFSKTLDFLSK